MLQLRGPSLPNGGTGANRAGNQAAPCVPGALQPILGPDRQGGVGGNFGRAGPLRWASYRSKAALVSTMSPPSTEPKQQQRPSMALLPRWLAQCAWIVLQAVAIDVRRHDSLAGLPCTTKHPEFVKGIAKLVAAGTATAQQIKKLQGSAQPHLHRYRHNTCPTRQLHS